MHYVVIGNIGSDAGYWTWDGHQWVHHGGWAPEQLREVVAALNVMREASRFKTPGLSEELTRTVAQFLEKQVGQHLPEASKGGVVIIA